MDSLAGKLTKMNEQAFSALGLPPEYARVMVSGQAETAQFQCNGAMPSAKAAKKNPREIALEVIEKLKALDKDGIFTALSVGGPGFINIAVTDAFIAAHLKELAADKERLGVPTLSKDGEFITLDYGGPNVAKAMHVGHLRSSIIGDSLRRLLQSVGYWVTGDVHLGDWGTPMGMLIADYLDKNEASIIFTYNDLSRPDHIERLMNDMVERYPKAAARFKEEESFRQKAHFQTKQLQDKQDPAYGMWKVIRDVSIAGMKKNFDALGVRFDLWNGESDAHDYIDPMVENFKAKGIAQESEGALVVPVAREDDKKEIPPLILLKSDGAVLYGTTDLGTLVGRMSGEGPRPAKIIYVVDQRQGLHFEQVFRAARKGGIVPDSVELIHAGFGTMNGSDGKPFKTRAGGVMKLEDLIAMGIERARERLKEAKLAQDMPAAEKEDIAHKVAIAAIKFADLQNNRIADYVFDLDRMTAFEGKTGPYLLYQAVRINSLLRKGAEQGFQPAPDFVLKDQDTLLALLLCELPDQIQLALKNYSPHILCDYAYKVAQEFSSFYGTCHILSESNAALRGSRLALCQLTARHLQVLLKLLGIDIPERM